MGHQAQAEATGFILRSFPQGAPLARFVTLPLAG